MIELRNSKTTYLGKAVDGRNRYAIDAFIGAVQMREAGGEWQDIDPSVEQLDADGSSINFTKTPMLVKVGEDSKRRIYPDKTDLTYWIEFQKPFASMGTPTRSDRWFYWNFAHALIGVKVLGTRVKFAFKLKDSLSPTSVTIPFTSQGITRQGNLLYHGSKVVAELTKSFAIDAAGTEREVTATFQTGSVTLSLNTTGLIYPITVDPTIDVQVGASADDGYTHSGVPLLNTTATTYYVGNESGNIYNGFARFTGITIAQGSTIDVAYLSLYEANSTGNPLTKIYAEDANDPAAPTSYNDYNNRVTTTAGVDEDGDPGANDTWFNTASIVTVIQELVDSYGYSNQAIQILHKNDSSVSIAYRQSATWDHTDNTKGPKLHIEYTEVSAFVPKIIFM